MLLLRAFAFCHVDVRSNHLHKLSIRREQWAPGRFNVFDASIGKYDPELEREICFLTQCLVGLQIHSLAIVWMYSLQDSFPGRKPLQWIKFPYLVAFLGPINRRSRVERQSAGMAQALSFGQISFAAATPRYPVNRPDLSNTGSPETDT
jgi:hypothetical protein